MMWFFKSLFKRERCDMTYCDTRAQRLDQQTPWPETSTYNALQRWTLLPSCKIQDGSSFQPRANDKGKDAFLQLGCWENSAKNWFLVHSDVLFCPIKHLSEAGTEHEKSVVTGTLEPNLLRVFTTSHLDGFSFTVLKFMSLHTHHFWTLAQNWTLKGNLDSRFAPESGGRRSSMRSMPSTTCPPLSRIGTLHVCGEH